MGSRCVPALLTAACLAWPVLPAAQTPPSAVPIRSLIAAYQRQDYAEVLTFLSSLEDLQAFKNRLVSETWSLRVSRGSAFEPRLVVAATIALEAVQLRGLIDPRRAVELLEAGCDLVRLNQDRDPQERAWHWAAIVLLEGLGDGKTLEVHVDHALRRFPDDPAFVMARAVAAELRTYPELRDQRFNELDPKLYELVVERLNAARAMESNRAEASLRLGSVFWRTGDFDRAIERLREAAVLADRAPLQYLSALLLGRALESKGLLDQAASAYEAATVAMPRAQTAEVALIAALSKLGLVDEAARMAARSVAPGPRPPDPWLTYGQGDLWRWQEIFHGLREALR